MQNAGNLPPNRIQISSFFCICPRIVSFTALIASCSDTPRVISSTITSDMSLSENADRLGFWGACPRVREAFLDRFWEAGGLACLGAAPFLGCAGATRRFYCPSFFLISAISSWSARSRFRGSAFAFFSSISSFELRCDFFLAMSFLLRAIEFTN